MTEAGYPLVIHDDTGTVIDYSIPAEAVSVGVEEDCYSPFEPLDIAWQIQNEYTSDTARRTRECLVAAGIEPAGTVESEYEQLVDAGLYEDCFAESTTPTTAP